MKLDTDKKRKLAKTKSKVKSAAAKSAAKGKAAAKSDSAKKIKAAAKSKTAEKIKAAAVKSAAKALADSKAADKLKSAAKAQARKAIKGRGRVSVVRLLIAGGIAAAAFAMALPAIAEAGQVSVQLAHGVSPSSGPVQGGSTITISGFGKFGTNGATVSVGGNSCPVLGSTKKSITCAVPAGTVGVANVIVTTPRAVFTAPGGFAYADAPLISSINPTGGPQTGGVSVTIAGANLSGAAVLVGNTSCIVTLNSAATIICVAPAGKPGAVDVTVRTPGGVATSRHGFRYLELSHRASTGAAA